MTTKDQDKIKQDFVHLYIALRRKKENHDLTSSCIRQIITNDKLDLEILKLKISKRQGIWRIQKTVNKRDCNKAAKILMHKLIDCPEKYLQIPSLWKSCLLQPEARGERNFLIDYDVDNENVEKVRFFFSDNSILCYASKRTPNGWHFITEPFDKKLIHDFDNKLMNDFNTVEIHTDGYIFKEIFNSDKK